MKLPSELFGTKACYYLQPIFHQSTNMSSRSRRVSILSNTSEKKKYCSCSDTESGNHDVYRSLLGPTPDESILAGLQTVIDMCGILETTNQVMQQATLDREVKIYFKLCKC